MLITPELGLSDEQLAALVAQSFPVMVGTRGSGYVGYETLEEAAAAAAATYLPIVINVPSLSVEADMTLKGDLTASGAQITLADGVTVTLTTGMRISNVNFLRFNGTTQKIVIASTQAAGVAQGAAQGVQLIHSRLGPDVYFAGVGHVVTAWGRSSIDVARGNPGTIYLFDVATAGIQAGGPLVEDRRPGTVATQSAATFLRAGGRLNRPLVLNSFGGYNNGFSDGTALAQTFAFEPNAPFDAAAIQLVFGNFSLGASYAGGAVNPEMQFGKNAITVKAALYNGEGYYPVTFNGGQLSARIEPGLLAITDRFPRYLKAGAGRTLLRVSVSVEALGQGWPLGITSRGAANGDVAHDVSAGYGGGAPSYHPIAVLGDPAAPRVYGSVGLVGDSIFVGGGGADVADLGYGARGLNAAGIGWTRMATYGAKLSTYTDLTKPSVALPNLVGVEHLICDLGANNMLDLQSQGLTVMQDRYRALWAALAATGAKVHQCTITPYDNTNPDFVAAKAALNDWFRTVPTPLTSCIDAAILAETAKNSNLWKPGYTNDGLHPNETGAAAISAAINPRTFLL